MRASMEEQLVGVCRADIDNGGCLDSAEAVADMSTQYVRGLGGKVGEYEGVFEALDFGKLWWAEISMEGGRLREDRDRLPEGADGLDQPSWRTRRGTGSTDGWKEGVMSPGRMPFYSRFHICRRGHPLSASEFSVAQLHKQVYCCTDTSSSFEALKLEMTCSRAVIEVCAGCLVR